MHLPVNVTSTTVAPAPIRDDVLSVKKLALTWIQWITGVYTALKAVVRNVGYVNVEDHAASIAATDIETPSLPQGLYQVSYTTRVTQAASTSSSLVVTVSWTDNGVSCSQSGVALTGNTTSTQQSGFLLIQIDSGSVVRYSTTYASVGGTPMQYQLMLRLGVAP
jgi:hypothetical protein